MTTTGYAPVDDLDVFHEMDGSGQALVLDSSPDTRR